MRSIFDDPEMLAKLHAFEVEWFTEQFRTGSYKGSASKPPGIEVFTHAREVLDQNAVPEFTREIIGVDFGSGDETTATIVIDEFGKMVVMDIETETLKILREPIPVEAIQPANLYQDVFGRDKRNRHNRRKAAKLNRGK